MTIVITVVIDCEGRNDDDLPVMVYSCTGETEKETEKEEEWNGHL